MNVSSVGVQTILPQSGLLWQRPSVEANDKATTAPAPDQSQTVPVDADIGHVVDKRV